MTDNNKDNEKQEERRRVDDGWHLDKRIPIMLILAIVVQSMVAVYGYGVLNEKVINNARDVRSVMDVLPRLVRLETLMEGVLDTLKEIRNDLRSKENVNSK